MEWGCPLPPQEGWSQKKGQGASGRKTNTYLLSLPLGISMCTCTYSTHPPDLPSLLYNSLSPRGDSRNWSQTHWRAGASPLRSAVCLGRSLLVSSTGLPAGSCLAQGAHVLRAQEGLWHLLWGPTVPGPWAETHVLLNLLTTLEAASPFGSRNPVS